MHIEKEKTQKTELVWGKARKNQEIRRKKYRTSRPSLMRPEDQTGPTAGPEIMNASQIKALSKTRVE
jgi:hypothetical protein